MNKTLLTTTLLLSALSLPSVVHAQAAYVAPTGAAGCTSCHNDNFGNGFKTGVINAFNSGGLQGLYNLLHPTTTPNTAPVLSAINAQWDVTVGEVGLVIPLSVSDKQGDTFNINGTVTPTVSGITVSPVYTDSKTHLPTKDVKWTPTTAQGNKNYTFSLYAQESSAGHSLKSNTVKTNVHVWPARISATKNVQRFVLQSAQWSANKLTLSGLVLFKPTVTAAQRTTSLNTLTMALRSNAGIIITGSPVKLTPSTTGSWTKTFTLTASQVPCLAKVTYEGLNAARTVTSAPAVSCLK
ncbi:MAG: hypothetical protein WAX77_08250 [Methylococcaceae bacterium]